MALEWLVRRLGALQVTQQNSHSTFRREMRVKDRFNLLERWIEDLDRIPRPQDLAPRIQTACLYYTFSNIVENFGSDNRGPPIREEWQPDLASARSAPEPRGVGARATRADVNAYFGRPTSRRRCGHKYSDVTARLRRLVGNSPG